MYPLIMAFILKTFLAGIWLKTLSASSVLPRFAYCQQGYSNPSGIILWTRRPGLRSLVYCQQGEKRSVEKLWRNFFTYPSQWWDHRSGKENARYPDFKHRKTQEGLWIKDKLNPPWVEAELAAMTPGTVQLNIFSWNRMLARSVKAGNFQMTMEIFKRMQKEGIKADKFTFVPILNACASLGALAVGRRIHRHIVQCGYESDVYVGSGLVNMYTKCGSIRDAQNVFDNMPTRNVVAWTAIILGHARCGQGRKSLEHYQMMQQEGVEPDIVTFVGVLHACASVAALEEGQFAHKQIIKHSWETNIILGSCLVDMYAKCGSVKDAQKVFSEMPTRNVVAWTAMLGGYAMHGHTKECLVHFEQMWKEIVEVNDVTFISLLSACNHGGLVDEGLHYFESMSSVYGVTPGLEHYVCMVDLFGRCGRLYEAKDLIWGMPCEPDANVWIALLGSCRTHGNQQMGACAAKQVLGLDPGNPASYLLLANICSGAEKDGK